MLLLKSLQLKDFLSHQNTEISFEPDSKILLEGPSGTGKSSIVEAIVWALYGVARTDNRSLIRKGTKRATVILDVYEGEKCYTITRSISSVGKHTLEITQGGVALPDTEGLRGYQNWIETTLIGASYLLFINSVAYMQGGGESFVGQTATKRKDLLLELVKADDFDVYYEKAREGIGNFDVEMRGMKAEIETIAPWLNEAGIRISKRSEIETKLAKHRENIRILEGKKKTTIFSLAGLRGAGEKADILRLSIGSLESQLERAGTELSVCKQNELELSKEAHIPTQTELDNAYVVEQKRVELLGKKPEYRDEFFSRQDLLKNRILELEKRPQCPSGVDCPHQHKTVKELGDMTEEIKVLKQWAEENTTAITSWKQKFDSLPVSIDLRKATKLITMQESARGIPTIERRVFTLTAELSDTKNKLIEVEKSADLENKGVLEESLSEIEKALEDVRTQDTRNSGELLMISLLIKEVAEKEIRIKELIRLASEIEGKIGNLTLVKDAFGSKGIKTVIVDYLLPRLEDKINTTLSQLSDFRIRLDTQKESVDGEKQVEGLWITIINEGGEEMDFGNYSGGERLRIEVAISEALASMQRVGFRLYDETFQSLDSNTLENFVSLVTKLQGMFPQIIMVSHLQEVKDLFETQVVIRKQDGISSVVL